MEREGEIQEGSVVKERSRGEHTFPFVSTPHHLAVITTTSTLKKRLATPSVLARTRERNGQER